MARLTGDTITDEQIAKLRDSISAKAELGSFDHQRRIMCLVALGERDHLVVDQREARMRCADVVNAIARAKCPGREHRDHVRDVCDGECCTACGGPIDSNSACRC